MKSYTKRLIILYVTIVILKIMLSYFILAPSAFSDYYGPVKIARSIFYEGEFTIHEILSNRLPLYPLILSVSYVFKDMQLVYFFMKVLNALMSSLIIFPAWLLSKEFFSKKKALLLTLVIAVLPAHFSFTFLIMPENLFFPLFLFSMFFIYKSFTEKSYKWDILAGIFIGLTYLTRINAIILPFIVILFFLFKIMNKEYFEIKKKMIMALCFLITISPWLIRTGIHFGFNLGILIGRYSGEAQATLDQISTGSFALPFLTRFLLYLGYICIASGVIFFVMNFVTLFNFKNKKILTFSVLTLLSTVFIIILAARHGGNIIMYKTIFPWLSSRVIGRYVEVLIPLILINGAIGLKAAYTKRKFVLGAFLFSLIILVFSSQLIFFPLFPINNMSLSWLGVSKFIFDFFIYQTITFTPIFSYGSTLLFGSLLVSILALFFILHIKRMFNVKKILSLLAIFFSLVSLLNFAIIYYNSYTYWYKSEQTQLGIWFNKYDPEVSTVLFDERDGCKIFKTNQTCIYNPFRSGGSATVIGFWMNDDIRVGSVDNLESVDYVISRHKLDLPLLKETKNGIFLYEANKES